MPKRSGKCQKKVPPVIWDQDAASSSLATRTTVMGRSFLRSITVFFAHFYGKNHILLQKHNFLKTRTRPLPPPKSELFGLFSAFFSRVIVKKIGGFRAKDGIIVKLLIIMTTSLPRFGYNRFIMCPKYFSFCRIRRMVSIPHVALPLGEGTPWVLNSPPAIFHKDIPWQ